jgi:hypothetical protein
MEPQILRSTAISDKSNATVVTMGIDIGKNSFHAVGLIQRGAIVLRRSGHAARSNRGSPTCRHA